MTDNIEQGKILLVDDNPLVLDTLKTIFAAEHYNVETSTNGEEALQLLTEKSVDLIICDVMMPKMDGYRLQEFLRQSPEFGEIPFIFLSASGSQAEIERGQESGADAYIVKPFDTKAMLSLVRGKLLRSKKLKSIAVKSFDNFRQDVIRQVSHEFRTPLVSVTTGSEFLLKDEQLLPEDKKRNLLEAVWRGGQRLQKLVNDFILLQQINSGIAAANTAKYGKPHEVGKLVGAYLDRKASELKDFGASLEFFDHSQGAVAKVSDVQINEIIDRIILNAIKFSEQDKHIKVLIEANLEDIRVMVIDHGIGFNRRKISEIVFAFEQQNRQSMEQQGSGLGLTIAHHLAKINGGQLKFQNNDSGIGALVSLILPRHS